MELTEEKRKKYIEDENKANKVVFELGPPNRQKKDIIIGRFGGIDIFTTYAIAQIVVGFNHNKKLLEAFRDCPDKSDVLAMVGAVTEIGYMIAEERYEQMIKNLEAKLIIAESEIEKLKGE